MTEQVVSKLKEIPVFSEVPEEQLTWLVQNSDVKSYDTDEVLFRPGDDIREVLIILEGSVRLQMKRGNEFADLGKIEKGDITGKIPFSRLQSPLAYLTVVDNVLLVRTHENVFPEMAKQYQLIEVFVHALSDRVRSYTTRQNQNEKLVALGKLSAGLSHELNNPASAMVSSASALRSNIKAKPDKFKAIMNLQLTNEQVDEINELVFRKAGKGSTNNQTLMQRTALEDELADWMEDHGIDNGFELAETFAEYCFEIDDFEQLKAISGDSLPVILGWVEDVLTTDKMVEEIEDSARRISELVSAVKTYSHMDRGTDKEAVELRKMVKSTITMLNHKSKSKQVEIYMDIPGDLPELCGYVGELNQVWTNLIDNAIDAVDEGGIIDISAKSTKDSIQLFFRDNGKGIPDDIKNRIFDPFFTTKDVGSGTGLGLDVVRKIMEKHEGSIDVSSKPGDTVFQLTFPI